MRSALQETIEVVEPYRIGCSIPIRVVRGSGEVKFSEQSALVVGVSENLGGGCLEWGDLRVGEIRGEDSGENIGAEWITALEKHRAAWRAFRHGPDISKADTVASYQIENRSFWRDHTSITEAAQLVNAKIIHDDEQNVGMILRRRCLAHGSCAVRANTKGNDCE